MQPPHDIYRCGLEKAFYSIPRDLIFQALRARRTLEIYINLLQDKYHLTSTQIASSAD